MKICPKCKAVNSDDRNFCVDCNERLKGKLSQSEEEQASVRLRNKLDKSSNKLDPLHVSLYDKIMAGILVAEAVVLAVTTPIAQTNGADTSQMWLFYLAIALELADALLPWFVWQIVRLRLLLIMYTTDEDRPNVFYLYGRYIRETVTAAWIALKIYLMLK